MMIAMRILLGPLIALSLFVALPALAQKPSEWIADARTKCRVWNQNPQPKENMTWTGACENTLAQGRGIVQWFTNGMETERYEGEYRDGKMNGHGIYTWPDGRRFEGEYRDNLRNGRGDFKYADGSRYDGEFRAGLWNGHGVYISLDERYEGEFQDGRRHGRGVLVYVGNRYEGEFRIGKPNGRGVFLRADGVRYEGEWHGDFWLGLGTNGQRYEGTFDRAAFHGQGVYIYAKGDRCEGWWNQGRLARGTCLLANGERYEGALEDYGGALNLVPHGVGALTKSDGNVYVGTWTHGCLNDTVCAIKPSEVLR
jgi:hypothetical protein